ncbi:hypothetical protein [Streptosporangium carneum]|uniref:Uncharacterized protein n=1 Tax=Streptosporangium carneum TaxID=47481 RepID=A0A9W6IC83_9ACTN|nr:hypothetical protein [Streptosporangium carneum]GLK14929.1 hypothetical protein GCM10017600_83420 [Streptosporangium carneum]
MNWCAALTLALVGHQANNVLREGTGYVLHTFAPVTGVPLPRALVAALQTSLLPVCTALFLLGGRPGGLVAVVLLALWVAVQNWRLSNHVWLAFLAVALFQAVPADHAGEVARFLLGGVYLTAGLFKTNHQFLATARSCGRLIPRLYAERTGLRLGDRLLSRVPLAVVATELLLGGALLLNAPLLPLFAVAAGMHLLFGLTGNFPFSLVALCLWAAAAEPPAGFDRPPAVPLTLVALASLGIGVRFGTRWIYRNTRAGGVLCGVFAMVFGTAVYAMIASGAFADSPIDPGSGWTALGVASLAGNLLSVVMGLRTEWAFTMFSNVRPHGPVRVLGRAPRWRAPYFELSLPRSFPEGLLSVIPPAILYQATSGTNVVYGPVAFRLERLARRFGVSLEPVRVEYSPLSNAFRTDPARRAEPRPGPLLFPPLIPRDCSMPALR